MTKQAGEAIVIDPGEEVGRIHRRLTELGLKLKQILITHGHIDHVGGALKLKRLTGAPILLNEDDLPQLQIMDKQATWLGVATPGNSPARRIPRRRPARRPGQSAPQRCSTPPATPRAPSVCTLLRSRLLIAGDTLFAGSIGRTDLPGGDFDQIIDSIRSRLSRPARRNQSPTRPRPSYHYRRRTAEESVLASDSRIKSIIVLIFRYIYQSDKI